MATKVKRRNKSGLTKTSVREWVKQFVNLDANVKSLEKRRTEIRDRLSEVVEEFGFEDPNDGHQYYDLGEVVDGVNMIKRERRVTRSLDTEKAMELIKNRGIEEQVIEWRPVINEEALYAQVYEGKVGAEELDNLVVEKVNYAFKPVR